MVFYDFMTIFRNFKNQSHRFMTIFNNLSNQGVASHSKIKTLRYFRLRSSPHQQEIPHTTGWTNAELKLL